MSAARIVATVRKTNDDLRETTWEWLLLNIRHEPIAVSWQNYDSKRAAWAAAHAYARQMHVGIHRCSHCSVGAP